MCACVRACVRESPTTSWARSVTVLSCEGVSADDTTSATNAVLPTRTAMTTSPRASRVVEAAAARSCEGAIVLALRVGGVCDHSAAKEKEVLCQRRRKKKQIYGAEMFLFFSVSDPGEEKNKICFVVDMTKDYSSINAEEGVHTCGRVECVCHAHEL